MNHREVYLFYLALSLAISGTAYYKSSNDTKMNNAMYGLMVGAGISLLLYDKYKDQITQ